MCFSPQRRAIIRHRKRPKVLRRLQFFHIFTSKCAFRHSGVRFFDIGTSKSAPKTTSFFTFSLPNVLFATAAYNFSTGEEQKVLRTWCALCIFTSKCAFRHRAAYNYSTSELQKVLRDRQFFSIFTSKSAFRHSGVQFLMSPLGTYLRTRRFNRPTFGLTRHTNLWKNTAFRVFSNI